MCCCSRLGSRTPLSSRVSVCFRLSRDPLRTSWRSCDVCGGFLCPCAFFVACQTTEWRPLVFRHLESRLRGSGGEGDGDAVDSSSHRTAHMVSALPALCVLGGYVERLRAGGAARLSHVSRACSWWRVAACLGFQYRQRARWIGGVTLSTSFVGGDPCVFVVVTVAQVDTRSPHGSCVVVAYSSTSPTLRITLPAVSDEGDGGEDGPGTVDIDAAEETATQVCMSAICVHVASLCCPCV